MKTPRFSFQDGFTLIELVLVIVLLGVLSIFVAPRLAGSNLFDARGFHDETMAYLRYAQKAAIAQRRTVCVSWMSNSLTLSIASSAGSFTCDTTLNGPKGENPARGTARSGVSYTTTPAAFSFDALGQPVNASGVATGAITIQVSDVGQAITVEALSGYVHD